MAEFVEVMKDWRRMCATMSEKDEYTACDRCPLQDFGCPAIYETDEEADWAHVESVVTKWVEENPVKQYPTWLEFVKCKKSEGRIEETDNDFVKWMAETPIPADMAQRLGIEPKE